MLYIEYPSWISPFVLPGLPIRWYGLMYLAAFATTYFLFVRQIKEKKVPTDPDSVLNLFFWAIVGLLIGARVFSALVYEPSGRFLSRPWLIFWPFDENMTFTGLQGMSYHGGFLGALIAVVVYTRVKKIDTLAWGDMLATGIPLGFTFGRLGNFINGELYGRVTTAPWGMIFPNARRLPTSEPWVVEIAETVGIAIAANQQSINLPRHPSQLYQAFLEGILLWAVMWFIFRKRSPFRGFMISVYIMGYGIARFIGEYFREPDAGLGFRITLSSTPNPPALFVSPWNFTTGQILSFLMIVGGIVCLFLFRLYDRRSPAVETFTPVPPPKKKRRRKNLKR